MANMQGNIQANNRMQAQWNAMSQEESACVENANPCGTPTLTQQMEMIQIQQKAAAQVAVTQSERIGYCIELLKTVLSKM